MNSETRTAIEAECLRLSHAFAYHLDHREYQALAELFAPDGVWVRHGSELRGAVEIVAALSVRPAAQFTRHITTGHHFTEITDTRAASHAYNVSYGSFDAASLPARLDTGLMMLLDFADTYTKTAQGWRFAKRITEPVLIGEAARSILSKHSG